MSPRMLCMGFMILFYILGIVVQTKCVSHEWTKAKGEKGVIELKPLIGQLFQVDFTTLDFQAMISNGLQCSACTLLTSIYNTKKKFSTFSPRTLSKLLNGACLVLHQSKLISMKECVGFLDIYSDTVFYILDNMEDVRTLCPILLQEYNCNEVPKKAWSVAISQDSPPPKKRSARNSHSKRILQLTDVHFSSQYQSGSNANCDNILCCLTDSDPPRMVTDLAGYWGDYRKCDVPKRLINHLFEYISKDMDFDYLYFTGDIIDHKVWATSKTYNMETMKSYWELFRKYFKSKVFPVMGNHESHPCNLFPSGNVNVSAEFSNDWLYNATAQLWAPFLPECALRTVRKGGYYTVSPEPGFRIIVLNSNVAYYFNFWLWHDDVDPLGQLHWLAQVLFESEIVGESVHILSHVPSGAEMYSPWANEFQKIVRRFSNVITGIFNGHTHLDELVLYYDETRKNPINVAFNGGSVTPYTNLNPNFKIYSVTGDTFEVLDYEVHMTNLSLVNAEINKTPLWFKSHEFRLEYNVSDGSPQSVHKVLQDLIRTRSARDKYFRNSVRHAQPSIEIGCDQMCQKKLVCNIVNTVQSDRSHCDQLIRLVLF